MINTNGTADIFVRNIIYIISTGIDCMYGLNKLWGTFLHVIDGKLKKPSGGIIPHIIYRQIHEKIIVGFSHLKERLTSGDIFKEGWNIFPNGICRTHVNGGIEFPSWPRIILGAVC